MYINQKSKTNEERIQKMLKRLIREIDWENVFIFSPVILVIAILIFIDYYGNPIITPFVLYASYLQYKNYDMKNKLDYYIEASSKKK